MKKSTLITIIIVVIVIAAGIYVLARNKNSSYNSSQSSSSYDQSQSSQNSTAPSGAGGTATLTLNTSSSQALGTFLVATNGMTLYKYTKDTPGVSNCTGQCATLWPPYTVSSASNLNAGSSITGQLGTITRADGTMQLTYNNMPLYFWHNDQKPGDTSGNNVGGVWFVVKP